MSDAPMLPWEPYLEAVRAAVKAHIGFACTVVAEEDVRPYFNTRHEPTVAAFEWVKAQRRGRPRLLGALCRESSEFTVLAVLTLTPEGAAKILDRHAELVERNEEGATIATVDYDVTNIRFFHEVFSESEEDISGLLELAEERRDALPEDLQEGWFYLDGIDIPEDGDYRTAYDQLRVGEYSIGYVACGKHAEDEFETPELPLDLVKEVAGDAKPRARKPTPRPRAAETVADGTTEILIRPRGPFGVGGLETDAPTLVVSLASLETIFYRENSFLAEEDVPGFMAALCSYAEEAGRSDPEVVKAAHDGYHALAYCGNCECQPCECESDDEPDEDDD